MRWEGHVACKGDENTYKLFVGPCDLVTVSFSRRTLLHGVGWLVS